MFRLPLELVENTVSYIPIGELIDENTSKETIEDMFNERAKDLSQPIKYLWTAFENTANNYVIVKITILCNEYIAGIKTYNLDSKDVRGNRGERTINKIEVWDTETPIHKRDILKLPRQGLYTWYGRLVRVKETDDPNYVSIESRSGNRIMDHLDKNRWVNFLKGGDDEDILTVVRNRIQFLDYNIIEQLTDKRYFYYKMLNIFELLYNMGYWTYGGFKNFQPKDKKLPNKMFVTYQERGRGFNLSLDGTISDVNGVDQSVIDEIKRVMY